MTDWQNLQMQSGMNVANSGALWSEHAYVHHSILHCALYDFKTNSSHANISKPSDNE